MYDSFGVAEVLMRYGCGERVVREKKTVVASVLSVSGEIVVC